MDTWNLKPDSEKNGGPFKPIATSARSATTASSAAPTKPLWVSRLAVRPRIPADAVDATKKVEGLLDDDSADLALAATLARSSKDLEEHEYAVRSVAESLEPHCSSMNVPEAPFVLHLPNVMHLATDVTGVLARSESTALALAGALHPSAAVCGTPKNRLKLKINNRIK